MFSITDKAKSLIYKLVAVLAVIAIALALVWANFKMIDAKNERIDNLNSQLTSKNTQYDELSGKYEVLKVEVGKKVSSDGVTEAAKTEVKQAEVKQVVAKTQAQQIVEDKLKAIETKYAGMEQTKANEERKRVDISLERAKGLWLTYCIQQPQDKACK
jgi:Tfp pilus assembly protein PilN